MATEALLPQKLREFLRIASRYGADHALSEIVDQSHAARSDSDMCRGIDDLSQLPAWSLQFHNGEQR